MAKIINGRVPKSRKKSAVSKTRTKKARSTSIYQIKTSLLGSVPKIWRKLQVPGNVNLGLLHAIIQVAVGWTNSHLHQFIVGDTCYSDPDPEMEIQDTEDEFRAQLCDIAPGLKSSFIYEYDFGDGWEHKITVEKIVDNDESFPDHAVCIGGKRACPPEDCGGIYGYEDMLEIIKNPENEEHETWMKWLGEDFDSEEFDIKEVNRFLKKIKWNKPTVEQLGRLLMERDREL